MPHADQAFEGEPSSADPVTMRAGLAALQAYDRAAIESPNTRGDVRRHELKPAGVQCLGFGSLSRSEDMATTWWRVYHEDVLLGSKKFTVLSTVGR